MRIRHLVTGIVIFVFALILSASTALAVTETFHETYTAQAGTPLTVNNRNGSITMTVGQNETVDIVAVKKTHLGGRLSDVEIRVNMGETFSIETVYLVNNPRVSVEYTISVPSSMPIIRLESSNGAIMLNDTTGETVVQTSNGAIKVNQHTGAVDAKTSNGAIEMQHISGMVSARTSNGSITIVETAGIEEAETSNGSISAEVADILADRLTLKTSNGRIRVWLSANLNADLNMKTSNGAITIHDLEIMTTRVSKTEFEGRIGSGGKPLTAKTSNGSIEVYELK